MTMQILIVDDEKELVRSFSIGLRIRGFKILTAHGGVEALALFHDNAGAIDLVITDYVMADMDGITLIKAIKTHFPSMPVMVITADRTDKLLREAKYLECECVMDKPFSIPELVEAIEQINIQKGRK